MTAYFERNILLIVFKKEKEKAPANIGMMTDGKWASLKLGSKWILHVPAHIQYRT